MAKFEENKQNIRSKALVNVAFSDKMKELAKKIRAFPWDLIFLPTYVLVIWCWGAYAGDGLMDFIEAILTWVGMNAQTIAAIMIFVGVVLMGIYTIAKWLATNHKLSDIDKNTASIPSANEELERIDKDTSLIKEKVDANFAWVFSDAERIDRNLGTLLNFKSKTVTPQGQVFSEIAQVYNQYSKATQRIEELEAENALLKERVQYLTNELSRNKRLSRDELEL